MKMITSPHILGAEDKKGSKCKGDDEILTPFKTELGKSMELNFATSYTWIFQVILHA